MLRTLTALMLVQCLACMSHRIVQPGSPDSTIGCDPTVQGCGYGGNGASVLVPLAVLAGLAALPAIVYALHAAHGDPRTP
jgi:hypothetical protein